MSKSELRKVELLVAWNDQTWTREVFPVPEKLLDGDSTYDVGSWFMLEGPGANENFHDAILVTVLNYDEDGSCFNTEKGD